jgi:hypothetical protein
MGTIYRLKMKWDKSVRVNIYSNPENEGVMPKDCFHFEAVMKHPGISNYGSLNDFDGDRNLRKGGKASACVLEKGVYPCYIYRNQPVYLY